MKILKYFIVFVLFTACSKENKEEEIKKKLDVDISSISVNFEVVDISKDLYNTQLPIAKFREKYPDFLDAQYPDAEYEKQRRDTMELNIYTEIQKKIDYNKLKADLSLLFRYVKYYYPDFKEPKVFFYSSFTENFMTPVNYNPETKELYLALDAFLGEGNKYYKIEMIGRNPEKIEGYLQLDADQNYLTGKVAREIINQNSWVPKEMDSQTFIAKMIYEGKIQFLTDAFLPKVEDAYKIGFTKKQEKWAKDNEYQVWNYFVENNYLFNDDLSLADRFLSIAPFSKFYTGVDTESPGRIGVWMGWQLCRKYFIENKKTDIKAFLQNKNTEEIFAQSNYKPKQVKEN